MRLLRSSLYLTSEHLPLEIKDQILHSLRSWMAQWVDKPHQRSPPLQTERDRIQTEYIHVASRDCVENISVRRQSILHVPSSQVYNIQSNLNDSLCVILIVLRWQEDGYGNEQKEV